MKKTWKFICLMYVLIVSLLFSSVSFAAENSETAPSNTQVLTAIQPLIAAESQYYNIESVKVQNMAEGNATSEGRMFYCDAIFSMTIKYSKVEELPHIKGLLAVTELTDIAECRNVAAYGLDAQKRATTSEIVAFVDGVEETFGKSFEAYFPLALLTDEDGNVKQVYGCENEEFLFSLESYFPQSIEQMYSNGVQHGRSIMAAVENADLSMFSTNTVPLYYRLEARDYANRYTSNASLITCTHGVSTRMDTTKYNASYTYYCHADCANFVSQAIFYGGMNIDDVWNPGEYYWTTVNGLIEYFYEQKGYLETSNFASCNAGGIITKRNLSTGSRPHVVICVMNDTVTHQYSAHTYDVKQCVFTSGYPYDSTLTADYFVFRNTTTDYQTTALGS